MTGEDGDLRTLTDRGLVALAGRDSQELQEGQSLPSSLAFWYLCLYMKKPRQLVQEELSLLYPRLGALGLQA